MKSGADKDLAGLDESNVCDLLTPRGLADIDLKLFVTLSMSKVSSFSLQLSLSKREGSKTYAAVIVSLIPELDRGSITMEPLCFRDGSPHVVFLLFNEASLLECSFLLLFKELLTV